MQIYGIRLVQVFQVTVAVMAISLVVKAAPKVLGEAYIPVMKSESPVGG